MLIGIDEVGRGPLAGPVIACAVLWPETGDVAGLTDSKRLSAKRRESLIDAIQSTAIAIGLDVRSHGKLTNLISCRPRYWR